MRIRTTTLAAIAAVLATPGVADARDRKTADDSQAVAEQLKLALQEIGQLQEQVKALQARVDGQDAALVAARPVAATPPNAGEAVAKADRLAGAVPGIGDAEAQPAHGGSPGIAKPASDTQFHVVSYFNESTIHQTLDDQPVPGEGAGFNIKRLYFGVDHQFDKTFSASVLTDIRNVQGSSSNGNNTTSGASTSPIGRAFYVKNAYLQVTLDPAFTLQAGAAPEPWIPYIESHYGNRYVENTLVDRLKLGNTADWGIHIRGEAGGGLVSWRLSAVDGSGYGDVNVTRYVDLEGRLSVQAKGFFAAVGGYDGHLGKSVATGSAAAFAPVRHTARRLDLAAGYSSDRFGLGGEYVYARDYNSVNAPSEDSSLGWSVFAHAKIAPRWSVFGRYDRVRAIPSLNAPRPAIDRYLDAGVQWETAKLIDLALVYKREAVDNGSFVTQNGTIGGVSGTNGTYDELGLFGQFKF